MGWPCGMHIGVMPLARGASSLWSGCNRFALALRCRWGCIGAKKRPTAYGLRSVLCISGACFDPTRMLRGQLTAANHGE